MSFDLRKTNEITALQSLGRAMRRSENDLPVRLVTVKPTHFPVSCVIGSTCPGIYPQLSPTYIRRVKVEPHDA